MTIPANPTNWVTGELATAARLQLIHDWINFFKAPPSARVRRTAAFSVPTGGDTSVPFTAEDWDTDTIHDNSTNPSHLTCKTAGKYAIWARVSIAANATGVRGARFYKNGVALTQHEYTSGSTLDNNGKYLYTEEQLAVNDYMQVAVYQNSGGALDVHFAGTFFGMTWIGT